MPQAINTREKFNALKAKMKDWDLFWPGDEVDMALDELNEAITELEDDIKADE